MGAEAASFNSRLPSCAEGPRRRAFRRGVQGGATFEWRSLREASRQSGGLRSGEDTNGRQASSKREWVHCKPELVVPNPTPVGIRAGLKTIQEVSDEIKTRHIGF